MIFEQYIPSFGTLVYFQFRVESISTFNFRHQLKLVFIVRVASPWSAQVIQSSYKWIFSKANNFLSLTLYPRENALEKAFWITKSRVNFSVSGSSCRP